MVRGRWSEEVRDSLRKRPQRGCKALCAEVRRTAGNTADSTAAGKPDEEEITNKEHGVMAPLLFVSITFTKDAVGQGGQGVCSMGNSFSNKQRIKC